MIVYYKLGNTTIYNIAYFDGTVISKANLKAKIIEQNKLDEKRISDMKIVNVQTKKEYVNDLRLIPNNASLIVTVVPLKMPKECGPMHAKLIPKTTTTSILACKRKNTEQPANGIAPNKSQKLHALIQNVDVSTKNDCTICHKMGGIENCPVNAHHPNKRLNTKPKDNVRNTRIPCSSIDGTTATTSTACQSVADAYPDKMSGAQDCPVNVLLDLNKPYTKVKSGNSSNIKDPIVLSPLGQKRKIPDHLICSICKDLIRSAVKIKCCGTSFCHECISNALHDTVDNECPECHKKNPSSIGLLAPNFFLRNLVSLYTNEMAQDKQRQPKNPVPVIAEKVSKAPNHDIFTSTTVSSTAISTSTACQSAADASLDKMGGIENCLGSNKPNTDVKSGNSSAIKDPIVLSPLGQKRKIPDYLLCGICKDLITYAVKINCCNRSFCSECISNALRGTVENGCPVCHKQRPSSMTFGFLVPNFFLRNAVTNYLNLYNRWTANNMTKSATSQPEADACPDNATANEVKIEANLEPIVIDVDAPDDDDDGDVIFVAHSPPPSSVVVPNIIEVSDTVDTVDELTWQALETITNEYNENTSTTNTTVVRPWISGDCARKSNIATISQFALYKCMVEKCRYATNSSKLFQQHMKAHDRLMTYFNSKNLLDEQTRGKLIRFRECAYCALKAEANAQFIEHMEKVHRRCILQCPCCFYRTIEVDNMLLHQETYHPTSKDAILLCGNEREFQEQDDDILKNADEHVVKIRCGQGDCTSEFACYNTLCAHLTAQHTGKYTCPYCNQAMILHEHTITEHLSTAHPRFEEFQCLICVAGFDTISAIREHMCVHHPSNYLFIGARRSVEPSDQTIDKIRLVYANKRQEILPQKIAKCTQQIALNAQNPMELIPSQQIITLEELENDFKTKKTVSLEPVPQIIGSTLCDIIKYTKYEPLIPLHIHYKCITDDTINALNAIESYIDRPKDIDPTVECNQNIFMEITQMLRHRCTKHSSFPIVFLQIEQRGQLRTLKIVRCKFQCHQCHMILHTCAELIRHFNSKHPNQWVAAKFLMESQMIESTEPKSAPILSVDFFYSFALACTRPNCMCMIGTRTQAIEHHNQKHCHGNDAAAMGNNSDRFEFTSGMKVMKIAAREIAPYVRETNEPHQMHLFECLHCQKLFGSLAKMQQHFTSCTKDDAAEFAPRFSMKKLFGCREDNGIRTYAGMKSYYKQKYPGKQCTPVNIFKPKLFCGLCDYNYKRNNDLDAHYGEKHACGGDSYGDKLLETMDLDKIDIDQCKYAVGCCNNEEKSQLVEIIDHLMKCERRFVCQQCPNCKFSSASSFVLHSIEHDDDADANANGAKIIENLQNIKIFLSLAQNMTIVMPNGLVVTMAEIGNTTFGQQLTVQISQIAHDAWKVEADDLRALITLNEQFEQLENDTPTDANVEQTTAMETSNVQNQSNGDANCDTNSNTFYEQLSQNTDNIMKALEELGNRPSSSGTRPVSIYVGHTTMDDSMVTANDQLDNVGLSKGDTLPDSQDQNDDIGDKRKKIEHLENEENHAPNAKTLDGKLTDGNDDSSQRHSELVELNIKTENIEKNAAVEPMNIGGGGDGSNSGPKVQNVRKIRRASINTRKTSGKKPIVKKKHLRRQKKPSANDEVQPFGIGNFVITQLRKITNEAYRDKTEREIMQLVLDRVEHEPKDATKQLAELKEPSDEILDVGKILSAELHKISNQKLTRWQLLRFLIDSIEKQSITE